MFSTCLPSTSDYTLLEESSEGAGRGEQSVEMTTLVPTLYPLSPEEAAVARRKCKRCGEFYTLRDSAGPCYYHPGRYREPFDRSGALVGWSCCAIEGFADQNKLVSVLNQNALKRDSKGCKTAEKHEEDMEYSRAIGVFPFNLSAAVTSSSAAVPPQTSPYRKTASTSPTSSMTRKVTEEVIEHTLLPTDTLQGLALRYNTSVAEIKRVNNLISFSIAHLTTIMIPLKKGATPAPSTHDPKAEAFFNFKKLTGASSEEAKYYLTSNDYNLEMALKEFKEDQAWEKSASITPTPFSRPTNSIQHH